MKVLQKSGQEPERKQLEERGNNAEMDEAVGNRLPERAVEKTERVKRHAARDIAGCICRGQPSYRQRKIGAEIDQDQLARGAAEIREGKRAGTDSAHRSQQGKRWGARVSWISRVPAGESARRHGSIKSPFRGPSPALDLRLASP